MEIAKQPGGNTDDAVRQPSVPIEPAPNPDARLNAARGNPSQARDESDAHYNIECIF